MKNKVEDLRNHLFAQLERLGDESLEGDALDQEIKRAGAVAEVSREVIASAKVEVDFTKATGKITAGAQFLNGSKALGHDG